MTEYHVSVIFGELLNAISPVCLVRFMELVIDSTRIKDDAMRSQLGAYLVRYRTMLGERARF